MNMQANELLKNIKRKYLHKKTQANLNNDEDEEKMIIEQEKRDLKNAGNNIALVGFLNYDKPSTNYITISKLSVSCMKDRREDPSEIKQHILKCNNPLKIDIPIEEFMTSIKFISLLNDYNEDVLDIVFGDIISFIRFIYQTILNSSEQMIGYFYNNYKDVFWYYEKTQGVGKKKEEKQPNKFYEIFFINLHMFYNANPKGEIYRKHFEQYKDSSDIREPLIKFFASIADGNI